MTRLDSDHSNKDPFRTGVKAGGCDDALHAVWSPEDESTLCGLEAASRNVLVPEEWHTNDWATECWTCSGLVESDEEER